MINRLYKFLLVAMIMLLAGCSWVKPLPGAEDVALMDIEDVAHCSKLGTTHTQTLNRVGLLDRDVESIKSELLKLAQNEAIRMRGDTIVAISEIKDGAREFAIYRCK